MNGIIHNYAINAQISYAAYANLEGVELEPQDFNELVIRLITKDFLDPPMSDMQALAFLGLQRLENGSLELVSGTGFEIIHHESTPSGFSATIFRSRETGEYHFAIRGTEPASLNDLVTDFDAVLSGSADDQIISMLNYYMRLITPAGESVVQVLSLGGGLFIPTTAVGLGLLEPNTPINVTGHSLGGHLADAFIKAFSKIGGVDTEAFTYNGLGIGSGLDDLLNQVASLYGITPDTTLDNVGFNVVNLIAEPGIDLVPNAFLASNQLGNNEFLFIEESLGIANHSVQRLVDALAVYDLLANVDTSIDVDTASHILYAVSNKPNESLEDIVNALGDLLGVGSTVEADNRNQLYTRIQAIEASLVNNPFTLSITSLVASDENGELVPIDTATLVANAQNKISYRYAFQVLNPFVIEGNTSIETDQFYVPHNHNFVLDAENFSDEYLEDRARFLALKIRISLENETKELFSEEGRSVFEDKLLGEKIITELDGKTSASSLKQRIIFTSTQTGETDTAQGGDQVDRLYGFLGNDILIGGNKGDYLEGNAGNDILYSNDTARTEDNAIDTLKGGEGKDTYYVGNEDIINDSDRDVAFIEHRGVVINGLYVLQEDGSYQHVNFIDNQNEHLKLMINGNDATITLIKDAETTFFHIQDFKQEGAEFKDGDFGITLNEQISNPVVDHTIIGTDNPDSLSPDANQTDNLEIQGLGGDDNINGGSGDDLIFGGSDIDTIDGKAGNDVIYGEAGNDEIRGSEGHDYQHGGGGNDKLFGNAGNDYIAGGTGRDQLWGAGGDDFLSGGQGDDLLAGDVDDDFLEGGSDNDILFGGGGVDVMFGGEGNDFLMGDKRPFVPDDWQIEVIDTTPGVPGGSEITLTGVDLFDSAEPAGDFLRGGNGNDFLFGEEGDDDLFGDGDDDELYGGKDNDYLDGGAGQDFLDGGEDDDILVGGGNEDILHGGIGQDVLRGNDGHDNLFGQDGEDSLDGGAGNDFLFGGSGNDTYHLNTGNDLNLIIDESGEADKVLIGLGIEPEQLLLSITGNNLNITLLDANGIVDSQMIITEWSGSGKVESIEFNDGAVWDEATILEKAGIPDHEELPPVDNYILLTTNDDLAQGLDSNDAMFGFAGDDQLQAGEGSDQLYSGEGNDNLLGQGGNDFLYGENGNDNIQGGNDNDRLFGGKGQDLIFGEQGDDLVVGEEGDDELQGGAGNDIYQFNLGDGHDLIFESTDSQGDVLRFGEGIAAEDVLITRDANRLVISLDNGQDSVTIANWFVAPEYRISNFEFSDGTIWDAATVEALLPDQILITDGVTATGSIGPSTYTFDVTATDGFEAIINDAGGQDHIRFDRIIYATSPEILSRTPILDSASRQDNNLILNITIVDDNARGTDASGTVTIKDYYTESGFIEKIEFADGQILGQPNAAPVVNGGISDQIINIDIPYEYQVSPELFSDGFYDFINFEASLSDGTELPAWLSFDPATQTFSGTPIIGDSQLLEITVKATDSNDQTASDTFILNVGYVNQAPEALPDKIITDEDTTLTISTNELLSNDFDTNGDLLNITSVGNAVNGFAFLDNLGDVQFIPQPNFSGVAQFDYLVEDTGGSHDIGTVTIELQPVNDTPLAHPDFAELYISEDQKGGSANSIIVDVLNNDVDLDVDDIGKLTLDAVSLQGLLGNASIVSGQVLFDPGTDFDFLNIGEQAEVIINYTISDLQGVQSSSNLTITIEGIDNFTPVGNPDVVDFTITEETAQDKFLVNTATTGNQDRSQIAVLNDGNYVAVWRRNGSFSGVSGQLFDASGNKLGDEFIVTTTGSSPDIAELTNGGFVVSYTEGNGDIMVQRYDVNGTEVGNTITASPSVPFFDNSKISALPDGGFVVVWQNSFESLGGQRFEANGNPVSTDPIITEFQANVTGLNDGGFYIVYVDNNNTLDVFGKHFDAKGIAGTPTRISHQNFGSSTHNPQVVQLVNNDILVVWSQADSGGLDPALDSNEIFGQLLNPDGSKKGGIFLINTLVDGPQELPSITSMADGEFVVSWISSSEAIDGIVAQRFDASANKVGQEFVIEPFSEIFFDFTSLASTTDDEIVVTWTGNDAYPGGSVSRGIYAKILNLDVTDNSNNSITIDVLANDTDADPGDAATFTLNDASLQGDRGEVSIVDNKMVFSLGDDFDNVVPGIVETVNIDYTFSDEHGAIASSIATVFIHDEFTLVGTPGDDNFNVNGENQYVYAFAGNDTIFISDLTADSNINAGPGDDIVNLIFTEGRTTTIDTGEGSNLLSFTFSPLHDPLLGIAVTNVTGGSGNNSYVLNEYLGTNNNATLSISDNEGSNSLEFSKSLPSQVSLGLGSLQINIQESDLSIHLENFDPDDVLGGPRDISFFEFSDGTIMTYTEFVSRGFDINGTDNDDTLIGTNITDRITGNGGNDHITSGEGDDVLSGGNGNDSLYAQEGDDELYGGMGDDLLEGGEGDDLYVFSTGDGKDTIIDQQGIDQILFNEGITVATIDVNQVGDDLSIILYANDQVTIKNWFVDDDNKIERFTFNEEPLVFLNSEQIESLINRPPIVVFGVDNQETDEDVEFNFVIPEDAFSDPDADDVLNYSAGLIGGGLLPAWLSFDADTGTFSGIPGNEDVGILNIEVTVTDKEGESVSDTFTMTVNNVNDKPVAVDDGFTSDEDSILMTGNLLSNDYDIDVGDTLSISSMDTLSNSGASIVNHSDGTFTYDAGNLFQNLAVNESITDSFDYIISDGNGGIDTATVVITINGVNDEPIVQAPIEDQVTEEGALFNYQVPINTFIDIDTSDSLTLTAQQVDVSTLPDWLSFDPLTQTFTCTPPFDTSGEYAIEVTATDTQGTSVSDVFTLKVINVINGDGSNNMLTGTAEDDIINGFDKNDMLHGGFGNDVLNGGEKNDHLFGGEGNDVLNGEEGNDVLQGMSGNDKYLFNAGWGNDKIIEDDLENNPISGNTDTVEFGSEITPIDLIFNWDGSDLVVNQVNTNDKIVIKDWYTGTEFQTEIFKTSDDSILLNNQVDQLIQAMAQFSAESGLDWESAVQQQPEQVEAIITASWQSGMN